MEGDPIEKQPTKDEQQTQDKSTQELGEAFLKELRAMPYAKTQKDRSFVILPTVQFKETENNEVSLPPINENK